MRAADGDDDVSDSSASSGRGSIGRNEVADDLSKTKTTNSSDRPPIHGGSSSQPHIVDYALGTGAADVDGDGLRLLSRSPHPYHHRNTDLLHSADRILFSSQTSTLPPADTTDTSHPNHDRIQASTSPTSGLPSSASALSLASFASGFLKDSSPASDSGTEADDEHFLKGLPAPRSKPHKGLRGMNEVLSGMSTPLLSVPPRSCEAANESSQPRRRRSRRDRRLGGNDGHAASGMDMDTDGGDSVAGSVYSVGDDKERREGRDVGPGSGVVKDGDGHTTTISPKALFQKLKGDATVATAVLDSREKDRRQEREKADKVRRHREIVRRSTELCLLLGLVRLVSLNPNVRPLFSHWRHELKATTAILVSLLALYPLRLALWVRRYGRRDRTLSQLINIPKAFEPAPLFYPLIIPLLVSSLLATPTLHAAPLLNLVLSLCTLPQQLIPFSTQTELYNPIHWMLSCVPMMVAETFPSPFKGRALQATLLSPVALLSPDVATLAYPLHQTLCWLLHDLTTTSLLPAELQLLSVALINLLLLAASPQAVILQALLWGGGVCILVLGGNVVRRGILLARIPRWRFRRQDSNSSKNSDGLWWLLSPAGILRRIWAELKSLRRARLELMYGPGPGSGGGSFRAYGDGKGYSDDSGDNSTHSRGGVSDGAARKFKSVKRAATMAATRRTAPLDGAADGANGTVSRPRRHSHTQPVTHTPSGRRKRATSPTIRAFFSLTHEQATRRTWFYAGYLYACMALVILAAIRPYVATFALNGYEPFGWALGYLFGDIDWFRLEVVKANLENWICLHPRTTNAFSLSLFSFSSLVSSTSSPPPAGSCPSCSAGWVEHIRQTWLGEATTRLLLAGYWVVVLIFGLAVVFTLSPVYEVDTRRKVFHFMMVAMLLPATFIDPAYVALALALVLAVFLLLDLLRASQLPPLSRPIATFLTPYVDGRDLRGPVVISHIFLLIGCAIPLWLSMASLPRVPLPSPEGDIATVDCTTGWEVPTRDVSMVAGVICVGLGDAAASLIGRRWGRRKWVWGGGKSLEGSAAFAIVVFAGLMLASLWLRVGGWAVTGEVPFMSLAAASNVAKEASSSYLASLQSYLPPSLQRVASWIAFKAAQSVAPKAAVCASVASLTETVLTGGNDNVVVPVILWTCVKSFGL